MARSPYALVIGTFAVSAKRMRTGSVPHAVMAISRSMPSGGVPACPERPCPRLASADAFAGYGLSRREALWEVKAIGGDKPLPLFEQCGERLPQTAAPLPQMSCAENVFEDYVTTRLTLRDHPVKLLRSGIGLFDNAFAIRNIPDGQWVTVAGLVITRQRPGTAQGVIFLTLEDDTGVSNVIVWSKTYQDYRKAVMTGRLLKVKGKLQREGIVSHVISSRIEDLSWMLDSFGGAGTRGGRIDPVFANTDTARGSVAAGNTGAEPGTTGYESPAPVALHKGVAPRRHPRQQAKILFGN